MHFFFNKNNKPSKKKPIPVPRSASCLSGISSMASSLSSLFSHPTTFLTHKKLDSSSLNMLLPRTHTQTLSFSTKNRKSIDTKQQNNDENDGGIQTSKHPSQEKRSFAVATGELFIGIATRLIKSSQRSNFRDNDVFKRSKEVNNGNGSYSNNNNNNNNKERIGVVMEDDIEPGVIWEQRVKDIEAENQRRVVTSPGFSFSAAGLLFPYHLGVAQYLMEHGYIKETTPLAGSSAGAIVCAVIASGASMQEALEATKILANDCRARGTAFRLGAVLRDVLQNFLPDDIHIKSNGRVRVAVTQILWRPKGLLVDQFDSKEDLINAVVTSSFIPGYLAPRPATLFRNRLCIDGGLTLFMPPTSATETVRVCAFPASRLGLEGIGISPDCNPGFTATPRQMFNWALEPAEDHMLDYFFELGCQDAAAWAKENPVETFVKDEGPLVENGFAK